jgi:UDP-3-O-[3-hydroxymyristoyl] glucosamine N-acyltransferase
LDSVARPALNLVARYPGVHFGRGVLVYPNVLIKPGAKIDDYCILGLDMEGGDKVATTIAENVFVGPMSIICAGSEIGADVRLHPRSYVGPQTVIGARTALLYGAQTHWKVVIGSESIIGGFCCDRASIGNQVIMLGAMVHKLGGEVGDWDRLEEPSPTIEDGAKIGMGAMVIGGVCVGRRAFVAGGAIVTKNVPPGALWIGTGITERHT